MNLRKRVLVVGTTTDYIESLNRRYPDRIVFLTDANERAKMPDAFMDPAMEFVAPLADYRGVRRALENHLTRYQIDLSGVACFDCESLPLAATLATKFKLPFPSFNAVLNCRSKYYSKYLWELKGVSAPRMQLVRSWLDVANFWSRTQGAVVMKPLTGSGSELVFHCETLAACRRSFSVLRRELTGRLNQPMYARDHKADDGSGVEGLFLIEEYIGGEEFSCDFLMTDNRLDIIRVSQKLPNSSASFGTPLVYRVPGILPSQCPMDHLATVLRQAAMVLGLKRTMGMVDFKLVDGRIYLLEMTPRPGGDCLPPLIEACSGFDILGAQLDFAEGMPVQVPHRDLWTPLLGVNVTAEKNGIIECLNTDRWNVDERVRGFYLKRRPGDQVRLPPEDYDSRSLGYVIFEPHSWSDWQREALEMSQGLQIEYKDKSWMTR